MRTEIIVDMASKIQCNIKLYSTTKSYVIVYVPNLQVFINFAKEQEDSDA